MPKFISFQNTTFLSNWFSEFQQASSNVLGSPGLKKNTPANRYREGISIRFLKSALLVLICSYLLAGCSSIPVKIQPQQIKLPKPANSESGWWYARFRINWPEDSEPAWHIDVLLSHLVVSPVLDQYSEQIDLWRFHRRAGKDSAGHRLSFIFYSRADTAAEIYHAIETNETLKQLMESGIVEKLVVDNTDQIKKPHIEDSSDPVWNEIIQKSWPYYIMGISEMWLDMINRLAVYNQEKVDDPEKFYLHIHNAITLLWENEGSHAYLHHLNALFAYKPMAVTQRNMMRF